MNVKRARKPKNPDLRTPQEKAEWEEIRARSVEMQRRARMPEATKPFDLWSYDTAHLLDELAGIREMILRVPITLQTKSALQSAIDRIWRVEEDVRFLLSLQRDMQASFARKAAKLDSRPRKSLRRTSVSLKKEHDHLRVAVSRAALRRECSNGADRGAWRTCTQAGDDRSR